MKAVILAGGKGIRMQPLTNSMPKALVQLHGKSLLQLQLASLKKAGFREAGIVVGYKKEKIMQEFGESSNGLQLNYLVQKEQAGTADAVLCAESFVGKQDFLLLYVDVVVEADLLKQLIALNGFDAIVVGRKVQDSSRFGQLVVKGKKLLDIKEKSFQGEEKEAIINAGIYRFSAAIFNAIKKTQLSVRGEFELTDSIKFLIKEGKITWVLYKGKCIDVSSPADLEQ